MKKFLIHTCILLVVVWFSSCSNRSEYPGYAKSRSGFYYKLIKIGEDVVKCQFNDYVTVDICYNTINDSVFFKGRRKFQISKPEFQGAIDECLTMLAKDDSSSFILS